ncbi:hypothetical protein HID58_038910, partial [Brassica napus]
MAAISSLFLVFTLFIVSLLIILALIIPIKSRHVFITGGGSSGIGLGLAHAHLAASEGARVSILARSLSKLADAKRSIKLATGVDVATFSADVRDYDAVSKAVNQSGPIDVLIVNQGVFIGKELEKQSTEEVKFMIDVNLVGSWSGKFTVTCHFIGYLLSISTSGMSPQRSVWHAFMEVMFGGLIRFIGLFFQWG